MFRLKRRQQNQKQQIEANHARQVKTRGGEKTRTQYPSRVGKKKKEAGEKLGNTPCSQVGKTGGKKLETHHLVRWALRYIPGKSAQKRAIQIAYKKKKKNMTDLSRATLRAELAQYQFLCLLFPST